MASINYDDKRFTQVEKEEKAALKDVDATYDGMIKESGKHFDDMIEAADDYGQKQIENANQQTDLAIEKIGQQKDQANKDYIKEQSGAYADWQKASDPYGVNAEKVAASGLMNSGYADSLQTQRYNAYQSRVATARETFKKSVLEYDNMIKDAKLQNNARLAEIAFDTLQKKLELSLQGFQYENSLIIEKANKKTEVKNTYYNRYQDIVSQINTERVLEEQKRQFDFENDISDDGDSSDSPVKISKNSGKGWNNGNVSTSDIKTLQKALGVTADGKWGSKSTSAAGGLTADEAWKAYQSGKLTGKFKIEVDEGSVLDLGYGPISASKLAQLVASGEVEEYIENGVKKFRRKVKFPNSISAKNVSFPSLH